MAFLQELRDLIQFKKSGELSEAEFSSAKAVLFGEAEEVAAKGDFDSPANANNRPMEDGKRYRRRSAADWIARMQKDLKAAEAQADQDARKSRMLAFTQEINNAFAPGGNSAGITPETIDAALKKYYVADGYIDWAPFPNKPAGTNLLEGRFLVSSGQAAKALELWTNVGEYHFDFAKATMMAHSNILLMDLGWYKIIAKSSKKAYENANKIAYVFNEDITKVKYLQCYWEDLDTNCDGIIEMFADEDFAGKIASAGIKADGVADAIATY